jgi:hypothetical protein
MTMTERQPRMIPNPLYCERCDGYGYRVIDAEWEPYAVQCPDCAGRRPALDGTGAKAISGERVVRGSHDRHRWA